MSIERVRHRFGERFGAAPELEVRAPGRINLIGEHTDYNDGFVFPVAIDRAVWIAASVTEGPTELVSAELGDAEPFDAETVAPGGTEGWGAYAAGMAWVLREATGKPMPNLRVTVGSNLPMGSGVSSSAALEMAFGVAWNTLAGLALPNAHLAKLAQKCENQFVGVNCGIMDQMASAMGRAGQAMFLDTRTLEIVYAPVPDDWLVVLCDTCTPRALTTSAYNERREQCEEAARVLGVKYLRDADLAAVESLRDRVSDTTFRRARHVVTENARCLAFVEALRASDEEPAGELMRASHLSLREDYEVSSPELDAMAEAAWEAPGVIGARMTGAGFGGACVALVNARHAADFQQATLEGYRKRTGREGELMICRPSDGAAPILPPA